MEEQVKRAMFENEKKCVAQFEYGVGTQKACGGTIR